MKFAGIGIANIIRRLVRMTAAENARHYENQSY